MAIVSLQNVQIGFEGTAVLDALDWQIQRGEKVGLVGPNGSGKTTLFRLITGELAPQVGTVTRARGQVRLYENPEVGYYDQEHASLDTDQSVLAAIDPSAAGTRQAQQVRAFLASFLFFGDEVYKRVGDLSGTS